MNEAMVHQNEKFKSDKEGHCFAVVAGVLLRCAWVTLTSSEVGLDHPGKLSQLAESSSHSCDDFKTVGGGFNKMRWSVLNLKKTELLVIAVLKELWL